MDVQERDEPGQHDTTAAWKGIAHYVAELTPITKLVLAVSEAFAASPGAQVVVT